MYTSGGAEKRPFHHQQEQGDRTWAPPTLRQNCSASHSSLSGSLRAMASRMMCAIPISSWSRQPAPLSVTPTPCDRASCLPTILWPWHTSRGWKNCRSQLASRQATGRKLLDRNCRHAVFDPVPTNWLANLRGEGYKERKSSPHTPLCEKISMAIPYGMDYTATHSRSVLKEVRCEKCQAD